MSTDASVRILFKNYTSKGFIIWTDGDGVKANHVSGATVPTECAVDMTYADGEDHTLTYVVDMVGGTHSLYVDAETVDTQTTTINESLGDVAIMVSGDGSSNFDGSIDSIRIFDNLLTAAEHALYVAGDVTAFWDAPVAAYRCDSQGDDTATSGNKIWDRTTNLYDMIKSR